MRTDHKSGSLAVCAASLLLALLSGAPLRAQSSGAESNKGMPQVVIGGRVIMTLRTSSEGLSPGERAAVVRRRLGTILTLSELRPADVEVRQQERYHAAAIYVRNHLLITVDRDLAQANASTPGDLARGWAQALRETLPQASVSVQMPRGPQVIAGNRILMTIRTGANGQTAVERAETIRQRLGAILTLNNLKPEDVEVQQDGEGNAILVRGQLLVRVDRNLAWAHHSEPAVLARRWAKNLRDVLPQVGAEVRPSGS